MSVPPLKRRPKTEEFRHLLLKSLKKKCLKPNDCISSEHELCRQYGVSRTTVREVISGLVAQKILCRLHGKGTFLAEPSTVKEIGIVVFNFVDRNAPFLLDLFEGIEAQVKLKGYNVQICTTRGRDICGEDGALSAMVRQRLLHGLFVSSPLSPNDLRFLRKEGIPFVALGNEYPGLAVSSVSFDIGGAVRDAVDRLVEEGRKSIGLIIGPMEKAGKIVRSGDKALGEYTVALARHSIPFNPSLVKECEHVEQAGYEAMKALLRLQGGRPAAVIVPSEDLTFGALRRLKDEKAEPDVAVVGFFHKRERAVPPGYLMPRHEFGRIAFQFLEEVMENPGLSVANLNVPLEALAELAEEKRK